jgi:hypothetical protein
VKDLKTQLEGIAVPAGEPVVETPVPLARRHPLLGEKAHQGAEWFRKARAASFGNTKVAADAKLRAAIQQTDGLLKALKKAGRTREQKEIDELRKRWLGEREQLAWGLLKAELEALGVSEKLYRSLKQGEADPVDVLDRFERIPKAELAGIGKDRLRALLTPNG